MTCDGCANYATRTLNDLPGVVEAKVDFGSKEAVVRAKSGRITTADLQAALKAIDFEGLPPGEQPLAPYAPREKENPRHPHDCTR